MLNFMLYYTDIHKMIYINYIVYVECSKSNRPLVGKKI